MVCDTFFTRVFSFVLVTIFVTGILSGCQKCEKEIQFEMTHESEVVIDSYSPIGLPFNLYTPEITTNSEKTFESRKVVSKRVREVRLMALEGALTQPEYSDLDFLKSIHVYIRAAGLPEKLVAWKDSVPSTIGAYLALDVTTDDLKEYIKKESYTLRIKTVTNQVLTSDHHIDVKVRFYVDAVTVLL